MTLKQSKLFIIKKEFGITDRGLSVKDKGLLSNMEYFVEFENIRAETLRTRLGEKWMLYLGLGGFAIFLLTLVVGGDNGTDQSVLWFYFLAGTGCLIMFTFNNKDVFLIYREDSPIRIEFLCNKPTNDEFEKFMNELFEKRRKVLNDRYGNIMPQLSFETNYNNQLWLLNKYVISQEEFDSRVASLNELFKKTGNKVGFSYQSDDSNNFTE